MAAIDSVAKLQSLLNSLLSHITDPPVVSTNDNDYVASNRIVAFLYGCDPDLGCLFEGFYNDGQGALSCDASATGVRPVCCCDGPCH